MRIPSSRRLIIAAAITLIAAVLGWLIFSSSPSGTLTIAYAGVETGYNNAIGFWVTNSTRQLVQIREVGVQIIGNGHWETLSETVPQFLVGRGTKPTLDYTVSVRPDEYRKLLVTPPTNTVWRAELVYISELKGFRAWGTKVRLALAARDPRLLRLQVNPWLIRTNFSDPITNSPSGH